MMSCCSYKAEFWIGKTWFESHLRRELIRRHNASHCLSTLAPHPQRGDDNTSHPYRDIVRGCKQNNVWVWIKCWLAVQMHFFSHFLKDTVTALHQTTYALVQQGNIRSTHSPVLPTEIKINSLAHPRLRKTPLAHCHSELWLVLFLR